MANRAKFTKTEFRRALEGSDGHVGVIARRLNVSRSTVYRYLDRYPELKQTLTKERQSGRDEIVEIAQTQLMQGLIAGDARLIMFALRHYDRDGVPGAIDLDSLFAPDVVEVMKAQGITTSDVVREFEALMRAQADKSPHPPAPSPKGEGERKG